MSDQKRLLALLGIMAGVAMAVAVLSIWLLYRTAFTEQRHQLSNLAQTQVQAILTLAEHVSAHIAAKGLPTDRSPADRPLGQLGAQHRHRGRVVVG